MTFNFSKFNTPEYKEARRKREEERARAEELRNQTATIVGVGLDKLGGKLGSPECLQLVKVLEEIIEHWIWEEGIVRFMTGGESGTAQIAFALINQMKQKHPVLKNILVVPFAKFSYRWDEQDRAFFDLIQKTADEVVMVENLPDYYSSGVAMGEYSSEKLKNREKYFADHSKLVIGVRPVVDRGYDKAAGILFKGRGAGMIHHQIYSDHNFTHDVRFQF